MSCTETSHPLNLNANCYSFTDIETVLQNEKKFLDVHVFDGMRGLIATKVNLYFYVKYYIDMYYLMTEFKLLIYNILLIGDSKAHLSYCIPLA